MGGRFHRASSRHLLSRKPKSSTPSPTHPSRDVPLAQQTVSKAGCLLSVTFKVVRSIVLTHRDRLRQTMRLSFERGPCHVDGFSASLLVVSPSRRRQTPPPSFTSGAIRATTLEGDALGTSPPIPVGFRPRQVPIALALATTHSIFPLGGISILLIVAGSRSPLETTRTRPAFPSNLRSDRALMQVARVVDVID